MARQSTWIALALVSAMTGLIVLAWSRPVALAGDPYGITYPIVQGIHSGHGFLSFAPLWRGPMKMPGEAELIAIIAVFEGDLNRAAQVGGIVSALAMLGVMAWALRRTRVGPAGIAVAIALVSTNPVFARAMLEPLPDLPCSAALALEVYFLLSALDPQDGELLSEETVSRKLFLAGLFAAVSVVFRINSIALWPAGIIAVAAAEPGRRLKRSAIFTAGFALGGIVGAIPTIALAYARKIVVPHFFYQYIDNDIGKATGFDSFARICQHGLTESPRRIGWSMQWPIAVIGFAGLAAAVFRERKKDAMILLAVIITMMAVLVPIHFEARYYVFAIPILTGAFVATYLRLVERIQLSPRIAVVLLALAGLAVSAFQARRVVHAARRDLKADLPFRALCEPLLEAGAREGRPIVVGISHYFYTYERMRMCPVPMATPSPIVVVPAAPQDAGLDYYLERRTMRPEGWKAIGNALDRDLFVPIPVQVKTSTAYVAETRLVEEAWTLTGPKRPHESCEAKTYTVAPGLHRVRAELASEAPLSARLEIVAGKKARVLWGIGPARLVEGDLEVPTGAKVQVKLCLGDALLSAGEISVRSLSL